MDLLFTFDSDFASTTVDVEPLTDNGRSAWRDLGFGEAVSATLTKSGALALEAALVALGVGFSTRTVEVAA